MSALGFLLIGFGILVAWSGFNTTNVFDVLRAILGAGPAPVAAKNTPKAG